MIKYFSNLDIINYFSINGQTYKEFRIYFNRRNLICCDKGKKYPNIRGMLQG